MKRHSDGVDHRGLRMARGEMALLMIAAAGACVGDAPSGRVAIADSLGVEVVTNASPVWDEARVWSVETEPSLSIGRVEGDSDYLFGRVVSAGWLNDGRIFAGDEPAHTVRVYSPEGIHQLNVGREGEGPGELGWISTVEPYRGDSLFVYDYSRSEVNVFDHDLQYARRFRSPVLLGNYWVRGSLPDGRFLLYSPGRGRFDSGPGMRPDSTYLIAAAPDGEAADTLGAFEITMSLVGESGQADPLYLAPYAAFHSSGGRIVWTEGSTMQYVEASSNGGIKRIARITSEPVPTTDAAIADFRSSYLAMLDREAAEGLRDRIAQSLDEAEYYPTLPATSNIKIDSEGNVWLAHYAFTGSQPDRWEIFDTDGRWQGTVATPPGLEIHAIGESQVLGLFTDELGVAYLRIHEIVKP